MRMPGDTLTETRLRELHVALVGNPNCGKTALFNALTGSHQKVANYPGVTVEKKEGTVATPAGQPLLIIDLPGTYSLRGRSPDEAVTRDAVIGNLENERRPDIIVCVADATNMRLMLRLVSELKTIGLPMVLALNMFDIVQSSRHFHRHRRLVEKSRHTGCADGCSDAGRNAGAVAGNRCGGSARIGSG